MEKSDYELRQPDKRALSPVNREHKLFLSITETLLCVIVQSSPYYLKKHVVQKDLTEGGASVSKTVKLVSLGFHLHWILQLGISRFSSEQKK